jgi:hypothetical protein
LSSRGGSVAGGGRINSSAALTKSVDNFYKQSIPESERHYRIKSNYVMKNN